MLTPQEKTELIALDKQVEKESVRKLRENKRIEFAVQFSAYAQRKVDQAHDQVVSKGVQFDCSKGCAYCCYFQVDAFPQETFRIARELKSRGDPASVIATLASYIEKTKDSTTFRRSEPCPFLVSNQCSVYSVRPMMCRKCNSLDVEKCKDPAAIVPENPELALKAGAIVHGTIKAYERNKLSSQAHGLVQGVLLALTDPNAEQRWYKGEAVFDAGSETNESQSLRANFSPTPGHSHN